MLRCESQVAGGFFIDCEILFEVFENQAPEHVGCQQGLPVTKDGRRLRTDRRRVGTRQAFVIVEATLAADLIIQLIFKHLEQDP